LDEVIDLLGIHSYNGLRDFFLFFFSFSDYILFNIIDNGILIINTKWLRLCACIPLSIRLWQRAQLRKRRR